MRRSGSVSRTPNTRPQRTGATLQARDNPYRLLGLLSQGDSPENGIGHEGISLRTRRSLKVRRVF